MNQDEGVSMEAEPVEVWFRLIKSADGYPQSQDWEELWARPINGSFRVESIPFFENRVSRGDLVSASMHGDGFLQFERVIERGRHSTFRILVDVERANVESVMEELRKLGADCEVTLDDLVAVDVPQEVTRAVEDFLVNGKEEGRWGLQDGFIFDPQ